MCSAKNNVRSMLTAQKKKRLAAEKEKEEIGCRIQRGPEEQG